MSNCENERKQNVNKLSMRMQKCGTLPEDDSGWLKNKVNKATYPIHFLFRDLHAFRMAGL